MHKYITVYGEINANRELEKGDVIKVKLAFGKYKADVYFFIESIHQGKYLELSEYEVAECEVM